MNILKFIGSILLCQSAGLIGSFFTRPAIPTWYAALIKPSFSPPDWLFSPVWITLYVMMGVSLFIIWRKADKKPEVHTALFFFFVQLILNTLWSVFFFGLRSPLAGLIEIIFLWVSIVWTILLFFRLSAWAGGLLIPYGLWVSFAMILNFSFWRLN